MLGLPTGRQGGVLAVLRSTTAEVLNVAREALGAAGELLGGRCENLVVAAGVRHEACHALLVLEQVEGHVLATDAAGVWIESVGHMLHLQQTLGVFGLMTGDRSGVVELLGQHGLLMLSESVAGLTVLAAHPPLEVAELAAHLRHVRCAAYFLCLLGDALRDHLLQLLVGARGAQGVLSRCAQDFGSGRLGLLRLESLHLLHELALEHLELGLVAAILL